MQLLLIILGVLLLFLGLTVPTVFHDIAQLAQVPHHSCQHVHLLVAQPVAVIIVDELNRRCHPLHIGRRAGKRQENNADSLKLRDAACPAFPPSDRSGCCDIAP